MQVSTHNNTQRRNSDRRNESFRSPSLDESLIIAFLPLIFVCNLVYLEPWHADILPFLEMKKAHGIEEERARDLFYGLWINDIFMKRVESDGMWSLFCPNEAPGLAESHSEAFEELYLKYEAMPGKARKVLKAREVWKAILDAQTETGTPYMLFKDSANKKSNQQNLGTVSNTYKLAKCFCATGPSRGRSVCTNQSLTRDATLFRCVYFCVLHYWSDSMLKLVYRNSRVHIARGDCCMVSRSDHQGQHVE